MNHELHCSSRLASNISLPCDCKPAEAPAPSQTEALCCTDKQCLGDCGLPTEKQAAQTVASPTAEELAFAAIPVYRPYDYDFNEKFREACVKAIRDYAATTSNERKGINSMENQYEVKPCERNGRITKLMVRNESHIAAVVNVGPYGDMKVAQQIAERHANEMNTFGFIEVDA